MLKAIIFDVGSVLVREVDRTPRVRAAEKLGLTYDELVEAVFGHHLDYAAALGEVTTAEFWNAVGTALNLEPAETTELYQDFFAGNRMDYDLIALIRSLRPQYKTAILSNALDDLRPLLQHRWRVADAFDEIVISAEVGCSKPDPEIYRITLQKLALSPEETVFIDDLEKNIAVALELGMHGIVFKTPAQAREELQALLEQI